VRVRESATWKKINIIKLENDVIGHSSVHNCHKGVVSYARHTKTCVKIVHCCASLLIFGIVAKLKYFVKTVANPYYNLEGAKSRGACCH
jgi:hypothetical protein